MPPGPLNPARLPRGTQIGPWRVVERRGRGVYGAVYLAIGEEAAAGPVALKLALHPGDERFAREVELLSRIRHPSVPRLVGHGSWQPAAGPHYPYLTMELVEGVSLYDWAREHVPTSRQALRALASLARALEATHAAGGVHRDVKGDNMLVSEADGRVFLTDFGSGHYVGAARLTWRAFPPGTPAYRSPEAWRSVQPPVDVSAVPYAPRPADDVFALGITAFRLVTGEYPPATDPGDEASHIWHVDGPGPRPARAVNARCCAELSALVSRMLSVSPEARGSARELAEALEQAAHSAASEADVPLFAREKPRPLDARGPSPYVVIVPRTRARALRSWSRAASLGAVLAFGAGWLLSALTGEEPDKAQVSLLVESKDGGTVAVGDSALTAPAALSQAPSAWTSIAVEVPPKPLPGQRRPDANGRCPSKLQVPINGGCWLRMVADTKECDQDSFAYKGACYFPVFPPTRVPTSRPTDRPDRR
jgi:serine/threonine protein kinase